MKKAGAIIGIIITFFILYFFQINFFNWFNIAGIKPNLFIVLVLCTGLFMGKKVAIPFGFFVGIYLDLLTGQQIGISGLMFMAIGLLGEYFDKSFPKDNKITILLMISGATAIFEIICYIYNCVRNLVELQMLGFLKIMVIEIIFNVLITIILYPIIRKFGDYSEQVFRKRKFSMTRYI